MLDFRILKDFEFAVPQKKILNWGKFLWPIFWSDMAFSNLVPDQYLWENDINLFKLQSIILKLGKKINSKEGETEKGKLDGKWRREERK